MGIELTREELDPLFAKVRELDPEQLEQAAAGEGLDTVIVRIVTSPGMPGLVSTATVAGAGAALGTLVIPGAGTVIGGVIGGIASAAAGFFDP